MRVPGSGSGVVDAKDSMECDREPEAENFNEKKKRETVNEVDFMLKRGCAAMHARVASVQSPPHD